MEGGSFSGSMPGSTTRWRSHPQLTVDAGQKTPAPTRFSVSVKRGSQRALTAPADAISAARTAAEETAATRETKRAAGARQRAKAEVGYRREFEQAILLWLDFAPEHAEIAHDIAANAVERAAVVGSGRVGRTRTLSLEDRAALAARAYIRHRYTDYEDHLEGLDFAGLEENLSGLDYRDIKRAAHRAVDDFLEQHRPHG